MMKSIILIFISLTWGISSLFAQPFRVLQLNKHEYDALDSTKTMKGFEGLAWHVESADEPVLFIILSDGGLKSKWIYCSKPHYGSYLGAYLREISYMSGVLHGAYKGYDSEEGFQAKGYYRNGKKYGDWFYYSTLEPNEYTFHIVYYADGSSKKYDFNDPNLRLYPLLPKEEGGLNTIRRFGDKSLYDIKLDSLKSDRKKTHIPEFDLCKTELRFGDMEYYQSGAGSKYFGLQREGHDEIFFTSDARKRQTVMTIYYNKGLSSQWLVWQYSEFRSQREYLPPEQWIAPELILEENYSNGIRNGRFMYMEGGVRHEGTYKSGVKEGIWKSYYPDGSHMETTYINGGSSSGPLYYNKHNKVRKIPRRWRVEMVENEYAGEGDDILSTLLGLNSDGLSKDIKKYLSTPLYRFSADSNQGEYKYWQDSDWQSVPIATIDKQLYQHDGRIYDKDSGRIVSYCNFSMYFGDSIYYLASFNESGMLKTFRYVWRNYSSAEIYTECDSLGNITEITDGMGRIVRTEKFKNGKGWWYDYYIFPPPEGESVLDWDSSLEVNLTTKIKSKDRLKNNFKVGR